MSGMPPSVQVWQTQDLQERVFGSVAMIGVTGAFSEVWQIQDLATFWKKAGVGEERVRSAARRGLMAKIRAGYLAKATAASREDPATNRISYCTTKLRFVKP